MSNNRVHYILSSNGTLSLIIKGKPVTVASDHPNYAKILDCIKSGDHSKIENLANIEKAVIAFTGFQVLGGVIFYNGSPIHNTVTDRILEFMNKGYPFKPLARFLENLMQNPSARSVSELYEFLEHKGMPITEDGCFMAYKGVRKDYMDKYSGTILNKIGSTITFQRNKVDDNRDNTCSYGLHVGTYDYASEYAGYDGIVVLVKVNPKDAVSVPTDHNAQKLRVCEYQVVENCGPGILTDPMYGSYSEDDSDEGDGYCEEDEEYDSDENDNDCDLYSY